MAAALPLPIGESSASAVRIVLSWLIRLRWFAICGQAVAIAVALGLLGLQYSLVPLGAVLAATVLTNVALMAWMRTGGMPPRWLSPAVLVLDVGLLTVLLYYTGGPDNPFAVLYVVHVAMATVVLGPAWVWGIVGLSGVCYGVIVLQHHPLIVPQRDVPDWIDALGQWVALLLVVGLLGYFIGRVMSALRTREAELATMRERAQINERLASLTTLAAGAAHELGTPLGTIAVVAKELELAARQNADAPTAEDAFLIRQQVDRCRGIIERMRGDVAGRSSDEPGRCEVAEVLAATAASLSPERQARLDVVTETTQGAAVAAPSRATMQALQFLVNNGFDASPPDARVRLDVTRGDAMTRFEVIDAGSGMDAETLRRATEPFFTTKDPGRGMGLGLFLVRLVAERNGGKLSIRSREGRGTTATLDLPAAADAADAGTAGA